MQITINYLGDGIYILLLKKLIMRKQFLITAIVLLGAVFILVSVDYIPVLAADIFSKRAEQELTDSISYPVSYTLEAGGEGVFYVREDDSIVKRVLDEKGGLTYKVLTKKEGKISNDRKTIGFIEKEGNFDYIKIKDLNTTKEIGKIEIKNNTNKYISSWSKYDKRFVLSDTNGGSVFSAQHEIYDVKPNIGFAKKLSVYGNSLLWSDDDTLFYITNIAECSKIVPDNECPNQSIWLAEYNFRAKKNNNLLKITNIIGYPPVINSFSLEKGSLTINYSVLNPENYADVTTTQNYSFKYGLK